MPTAEILLAMIMIAALNFYVVSGGADYGGGVWDLLAWGKRAQEQKELIQDAIGPIWEANHVWLILVIVVLFTGFPSAFATITTYLHIPLTLMLFGIILRGSAFTFRTYDSGLDHVQRRWGRIFAVSSTITPILLGIVVGAISSSNLNVQSNDFLAAFVWTWLRVFPITVGLFALVLFAFLAAVYLTVEAEHAELKNVFRRRALVTAMLVALLAACVFILSLRDAPDICHVLTSSIWSIPLVLGTSVMAMGAILALWFRKYEWARLCAIGQASLILWGWALAQYPYLVHPMITIFSSAAPPATLYLLLGSLILGACLLFPSLYYLLKVFKSGN